MSRTISGRSLQGLGELFKDEAHARFYEDPSRVV